MPSPHEKLEDLLRGMRQRQEQQAEAAALWRRALPRCEAIAQALVEPVRAQGLGVEVVMDHGELAVVFADRDFGTGLRKGALWVCRFNAASKSLEAHRRAWHYPEQREQVAVEHCFSLTVAAATARAHVNEFGPSPTGETVSAGSKEAFEDALAGFLEWALVKDGTGGEPVRLP